VQVDDLELLLHEIGVEYHVRTELYDRQVCTVVSTRTGSTERVAIPIDGFELGKVNANARREREMAYKALDGIASKQQIDKAIQKTADCPEVKERLR